MRNLILGTWRKFIAATSVMAEIDPTDQPPGHAEINFQLERILASLDFVSAPKMRNLLNHIVDASIERDEARLKGYSIGVDVFERSSDFDPAADSIVRVQVGRLRRLLSHYYLTAGAKDPVRISIPKGHYQAEFDWLSPAAYSSPDHRILPDSDTQGVRQDNQASDNLTTGSKKKRTRSPPLSWLPTQPQTHHAYLAIATLIAALLTWSILSHINSPHEHTAANGETQRAGVGSPELAIGILPIRAITGTQAEKIASHELTGELINKLAKIKSFTLIDLDPADTGIPAQQAMQLAKSKSVLFVLTGTLRQTDEHTSANVQMMTPQGKVIWAEDFKFQATENRQATSDLATKITSEVRLQIFMAAKQFAENIDATKLSAQQLFLLATWTPGNAYSSLEWEMQGLQFAQRAIAMAPNYGPAHSALADKLAFLASINPPSDTPLNLAKAAYHAQRAIELSADDPDAVFNVALHYWHTGQLAKSRLFFKRTLDLDSSHTLASLMVDLVPYTCQAAPDEIVAEATRIDKALAADNPIRWVTHYWLAILAAYRGEFDAAIKAAQQSTQIFKTPGTTYLWAAALLKLGKKNEALQLIRNEHRNWPNLDPKHYAAFIANRKCHQSDDPHLVVKFYADLAQAYSTAN